METPTIAFIGAGNMSTAIVSGLLKQGFTAEQIHVVEPNPSTRADWETRWHVNLHPHASQALATADLVVWAVKPQVFQEAAAPVAAFTQHALHFSVAAGIPTDSIARWTKTERIIRTMPNTPALIGKGMTGLYARSATTAADRTMAETIARTLGEILWVTDEDQLDAVTALSGSGPAYVFYFLEAMRQAGVELGLSAQQAQTLAQETFYGASALARDAKEPPEVLRARVTSKGGTTFAAISHLEAHDVKSSFVAAMHAAQKRAKELGQEFGASD